LRLKKTKAEWEFLERNNYKNLDRFLRSEIDKLVTKFNKCPNCISKAGGEPVEKRPRIHRTQYEQIEIIAKKMKISPSRVIDRLIIAPLLMPEP
jgi:hypothetical protein